MVLELTFVVIKPHVVKVPFVLKAIQNIILQNGFYIVKSDQFELSKSQIKQFYEEHEGKFFYNRLATLMVSGPIEAYVLARIDAIQEWRKLMGPTKVYEAQYSAPNSIRGMYGLTDTRNATHGADSTAAASREMSILYPDFDPMNWMKSEEEYFRNGSVKFSSDEFIHSAVKS